MSPRSLHPGTGTDSDRMTRLTTYCREHAPSLANVVSTTPVRPPGTLCHLTYMTLLTLTYSRNDLNLFCLIVRTDLLIWLLYGRDRPKPILLVSAVAETVAETEETGPCQSLVGPVIRPKRPVHLSLFVSRHARRLGRGHQGFPTCLDLRPLRSTQIYRIGKAAKPQIGTTQNTPPEAFIIMVVVRCSWTVRRAVPYKSLIVLYCIVNPLSNSYYLLGLQKLTR